MDDTAKVDLAARRQHRASHRNRRLTPRFFFHLSARGPPDHPRHSATHDSQAVGCIHNNLGIHFEDAAVDDNDVESRPSHHARMGRDVGRSELGFD
jgi:hypothetical protein